MVFILIILFVAIPKIPLGQDLPLFHIMTEDWVPYQYEKDGKLEGVAVDLLVLILDRIGSIQTRKDINIYPWARGYDMLQHIENTILFSTTRTLEREHLFEWVGPIFQNSTFLIGKKSKHFRINSADELKNYRIGTIIDDASELYLIRLGVPLKQFQRNTTSLNNLKKMGIDRIDMIVSGWIAFENDAKRLSMNPNHYEKVYHIETADVSYAFNIKTPDWIIQKFQSALDEIKSEGKLDKIINKYKHLMK